MDESAQRKKKKNNDPRDILIWTVLFTRTNFLIYSGASQFALKRLSVSGSISLRYLLL